jgi:CheY-like chemotaxis protein
MMVVPDLFFSTKISATAEAAGVALEAPALGAVIGRCREQPPALLILDLGEGEPPLEIARVLKADRATARIPIVGFYSHVDRSTHDAALAAGVDQVLPRSAFVAKLPALLVNAPA